MSWTAKKKPIGGNGDDPFYRYQRDVIVVGYTKRKGGRTTLLNIDLIQKQLHMPDAFIIAFYKKVKKTGKPMIKNGVFRGEHAAEVFEALLEPMIVKYVLCPVCGLPELDEERKCQACGQ